jgi:hypothetical protein
MDVYQLWPVGDESYPRIDYRHPRNRSVDWTVVDAYLRGVADAPTDEPRLFVKSTRRFDAQHISGSGWVVSERLRAVFEPLIADDVTFVPLMINADRFWGLRITRVLFDALDMQVSDLAFDPSGSVKRIDVPV